MKTYLDIATIIFFLFSIPAVLISISTFKKTIKIKKAEWLSSLSDKFYRNKRYRKIRRILDYPEIEKDSYSKLKISVEKSINDKDIFLQEEISLLEEFVDYLNFFEMIGALEKLKQLNFNEIKIVFDYYLKLIKRHDWIIPFLKCEGFELTFSLIDRV